MIEVGEAKRLLFGQAEALDVVEVELEKARGRVLAEDVAADRDFPPTDRSTMDGFAVRSADVVEPGRELEVSGEVQAGRAVGDARVEPGHAIRIMTGAPLPAGADAVVMVEYTERDDPFVKIFRSVERGENIGAAGEDVGKGERVAGVPARRM